MALKITSQDELPSVNMTPMIDVVFLLIIFFMVGTQFTGKEKHIDLSLPGAGQLNAMIAPPERRVVSVTAEGNILLDGAQVDLEQLTTRLQALRNRYPAIGVVVRADGNASHQNVASVYGAVNRAGVADMSIAVRSQSTQLR